MSQANVELWRASIEAEFSFRAGASEFDPEATISKMAELWDPELELDISEFDGPDVGGVVYRGGEAVRQFWREWFAAWETLQFEYELLDAGDRVVMLLDLRMRGRSSGVEVALGKHAWVTTFRDGLMVHSKLYMSQSEALEAAGLTEQAMPKENVEIVLGQYAATNERDFERVMSQYADDVELVAREPHLQTGRFRGREAVGRWFGDWLSTFDRDARFDVKEARELPTGAVLIVADHHARGRASGAEVQMTVVWVYRLRQGKITRVEGFSSREEALEAAGLEKQV